MSRPSSSIAALRPGPGALGRDAVAGLAGAVASVPSGMASAVLVGVNPVYGLYASMAGPVGGGLMAGTRLMVVTTTTAAALAAGSALTGFSGTQRSEALFVLTALAGLMMIAAGLLRLGRYMRFVSVSVLTGFLTGVAVNIILGQSADLLGSPQTGSPALVKAWNVAIHPGEISLTAAAVGLTALALMVLVSRTRLAPLASLIALAVPTLFSLGAGDLARVADTGRIPTSFPTPHLPALSLLTSLQLVTGAAAVTVIVLVQGAGVAEAAPNADGPPSRANRDFIAQGVGNLASSLFRGQPVGGSLSQTALNVAAGARSRWASILTGAWMVLILVLFSGLVGEIPLPTLAAVLIFAAAGSLRLGRIDTVLRTGLPSRVAFVTTLVATLLLPVAAAVGIGVTLSLVLQLNQEATDLSITRLELTEDGRLVETPAPAKLAGHEVTALDVHGSLLFAGARTLQAHLPDPTASRGPVVVLRLRGRTTLGATAFIVLADYAERLRSAGGHLFLSGVDPELVAQLKRTHRVDLRDAVTIVEASGTVLESTLRAYAAAEAWQVEHAARASGDAPEDSRPSIAS